MTTTTKITTIYFNLEETSINITKENV